MLNEFIRRYFPKQPPLTKDQEEVIDKLTGLKPCQCGRLPYVEKIEQLDCNVFHQDPYKFQVRCQRCEYQTGRCTNRLLAIKDWNAGNHYPPIHKIAEVLREYHQELTDRNHGRLAQDRAMSKIQDLMRMHWSQR